MADTYRLVKVPRLWRLTNTYSNADPNTDTYSNAYANSASRAKSAE